MEAKRNITGDHHKEEEEDVEDELLKTRISSHPLYGKLVENHLNCLKVGGIAESGRNSKTNQGKPDYNRSMQLNQSELDLFMVQSLLLLFYKPSHPFEFPSRLLPLYY
ncbi:hypothetical protein CRYUN_Cryun12cG0126200 [Craigia yunnanensis]